MTLKLRTIPGQWREVRGEMNSAKPVEILMVDDNPGDARLTQEAFKEIQLENRFQWMPDGDEALAFLRRQNPHEQAPQPDLILLDLNMPRKDGRQVLAELKGDPALSHIPVIVLTTSQAEDDVANAYQLEANCYINKPVSLQEFIDVVQSIRQFWFDLAQRPPHPPAPETS